MNRLMSVEFWRKVARYPEKIPADKRLHFLLGAVFTSMLLIVGVHSLLVSALLIAFSFGMEVVQRATNSGKYDTLDAIATLIGGIVVHLPVMFRGL